MKVKASKLETLGAWLGLWTPPRDVVVAPVPWRKVALAAAGVALLAAFTAAVIAPAIDDAKDESRAEQQRAEARLAAERRARIERMQQPRFGRASASAPRSEVLDTVSVAITDDARARFSKSTSQTQCEVVAGVDPGLRKVAYKCLAETSAIEGAGVQAGARGALGYPYRAIVDFQTGRFAFCRTNPVPSEKAITDPRKRIGLPRACLLDRPD